MTLVALAANVEPWQGMVAIVALASVVAYLFKWADGRVTKSEAALTAAIVAHAIEIGRLEAREVQIRAECEARLVAATKLHAEALRQDHLDNRMHEDELRKEFINVVATISDQTSKSAEALTEVLGRLHDRFASPPRPRQ